MESQKQQDPGRIFRTAAARSLAILLGIGGVLGGAAVAGLVVGWHELRDGVLHLYQVCRVLIQHSSPLTAGLSSVASALTLLAVTIWTVSTAWDGIRARALRRRLVAKRLDPSPGVHALISRLGLHGHVTIVADRAIFALTAGIIRPEIFLSDGLVRLLAPAEIEAVIRHEACHIRRKDPLRVLLGRSVTRALFFIPVANDLWTRSAVASELAADAAAVEAQGRRPLARALITLVGHATDRPGTVPVVGADSMLDRRLTYLLDPKNNVDLPRIRSSRIAISAGVLLLALGTISMYTPPSFLDVLAHAGLGCTL